MSPSETSSSRRKWSVVPSSTATWQHMVEDINEHRWFSHVFPTISIYFSLLPYHDTAFGGVIG
jgi:hypothetical protein